MMGRERKKIKKEPEEKRIAMRVSRVSILVNLFLSVFKLIAGVISHSGAMISDAVHSASDVFSTIIVMIGVTVSGKQADKEHPYGHERLECVASVLLAMALFATGAGIGYNGVMKIVHSDTNAIQIPGLLALSAAILSIAVKEWMYWYTKIAADKIHSGALKADAWHHRSDALSSVGALIGIVGSRMGFPILDSVASVIICIFIVFAAYGILKDSFDGMIDKSCDEKTESRMRQLISGQEGVLGVSMVQTRRFGSKIYVDVEIEADGSICLFDAHEIAQRVHDKIESEFLNVKHCMVHVNPYHTEK